MLDIYLAYVYWQKIQYELIIKQWIYYILCFGCIKVVNEYCYLVLLRKLCCNALFKRKRRRITYVIKGVIDFFLRNKQRTFV